MEKNKYYILTGFPYAYNGCMTKEFVKYDIGQAKYLFKKLQVGYFSSITNELLFDEEMHEYFTKVDFHILVNGHYYKSEQQNGIFLEMQRVFHPLILTNGNRKDDICYKEIDGTELINFLRKISDNPYESNEMDLTFHNYIVKLNTIFETACRHGNFPYKTIEEYLYFNLKNQSDEEKAKQILKSDEEKAKQILKRDGEKARQILKRYK